MTEKSTRPDDNRRPLETLHHGDHIIYDCDDYGSEPVWQISSLIEYADSNRRPMVAATLTLLGGGEPVLIREPRGTMVRLASADEITAAADEAARDQVIADLDEFGSLLTRLKLRLVGPFGGPDLVVRLEPGEIDRVAQALDAPMREYATSSRQVVWQQRDRSSYLSVRFIGDPAPEPDPAPVYQVDIVDGTPYVNPAAGPMPGYVVGLCGHRVAGSEWRAGLRTCERCPSWSGPVSVAAPASATDVADAVLASLAAYVCDSWTLDVEVDLAGTVQVIEQRSGDVIARGTVTGPRVGSPEHYHAGGSGGVPGECSATCACGVTYAGFDTVAEAGALLDQHIAAQAGE